MPLSLQQKGLRMGKMGGQCTLMLEVHQLIPFTVNNPDWQGELIDSERPLIDCQAGIPGQGPGCFDRALLYGSLDTPVKLLPDRF